MEKKNYRISDRHVCVLHHSRCGNYTECTGSHQSYLYDQKIQEKKTYKSSSATYSYELPQLKGNSTAVKRINQSLKSSYNNDLSLKKTLFKEFNDYKKNSTLNKRSMRLYVSTKCTCDYNKDGYIRFAYRFAWHGCGSYDANKTTVIYRLKDGKRVSSIPASATDKKALNLVKGT